MSVSFWKLSPELVSIGGTEEARWLDEYMGSEDDHANKYTISDETLKDARELTEDESNEEKMRLNNFMLETLGQMLDDHKKKNKGKDIGAGGADWFELEVSW